MLARGYDAQLIPGVPSICAVAAKLGTSLCEGAERLLVVPASYEGVDDCLDFPANKAFMKAEKSLPALRDKLRERGLDGEMVANCGMASERVYRSLEELEEGEGYFSVVLVKEHRSET